MKWNPWNLSVRRTYWQNGNAMTITYTNGSAVEALLLSREDDSLRVAVPGDNDLRTFCLINGTWFSESGEQVNIEFAGQRNLSPDTPTEDDCFCPKKLASYLMSLLVASGEGEDLLEDFLYELYAEASGVRVKSRSLYRNRMSAVLQPLCSSDSALAN